MNIAAIVLRPGTELVFERLAKVLLAVAVGVGVNLYCVGKVHCESCGGGCVLVLYKSIVNFCTENASLYMMLSNLRKIVLIETRKSNPSLKLLSGSRLCRYDLSPLQHCHSWLKLEWVVCMCPRSCIEV